jgi:hypothetical protein
MINSVSVLNLTERATRGESQEEELNDEPFLSRT